MDGNEWKNKEILMEKALIFHRQGVHCYYKNNKTSTQMYAQQWRCCSVHLLVAVISKGKCSLKLFIEFQ